MLMICVFTDSPPSVPYFEIVRVVNGNANSTLTVEWSITNGMEEFSIQVLPIPLYIKRPPVANTDIFSTNVTLLYNINYTLTINLSNCAGLNKAELTLFQGVAVIRDKKKILCITCNIIKAVIF